MEVSGGQSPSGQNLIELKPENDTTQPTMSWLLVAASWSLEAAEMGKKKSIEKISLIKANFDTPVDLTRGNVTGKLYKCHQRSGSGCVCSTSIFAGADDWSVLEQHSAQVHKHLPRGNETPIWLLKEAGLDVPEGETGDGYMTEAQVEQKQVDMDESIASFFFDLAFHVTLRMLTISST